MGVFAYVIRTNLCNIINIYMLSEMTSSSHYQQENKTHKMIQNFDFFDMITLEKIHFHQSSDKYSTITEKIAHAFL